MITTPVDIMAAARVCGQVVVGAGAGRGRGRGRLDIQRTLRDCGARGQCCEQCVYCPNFPPPVSKHGRRGGLPMAEGRKGGWYSQELRYAPNTEGNEAF